MVQPRARTKNVTSYRVIYGDTDQMGVVYYANYLRWFEKGRSEFLRQIDLPYKTIEEQGLHFPVTEVSCRYFRSARYDDVITIATQLTSVGRATLNFDYTISREADSASLASGSTRHACVDADGRITRIPMNLAQRLARALVTPTESTEH
ncbi:MAG: thioesterase family protein [Candidatus Binatia bacterium]|jgi:acyl-CoA thioester hydrolase, YbgC/YbaW family